MDPSNLHSAAAASTSGVWSQSLWLSVLAGLSTCIGAGVVLLVPRPSNKKNVAPPLRKAHLAAALSLAGSVMMTVSLCSLLPEALEGPDGSLLPVTSWAMVQRLTSLVTGAVLYGILSKCAFPEPEAILGFEEEQAQDTTTTTMESSNENAEHLPLMEVKQMSPAKNKAKTNQASLRIRSQVSSTGSATLAKDEEKAVTSTDHSAHQSSDESSSITNNNNGNKSTTTLPGCSWWTSYSSGQDLASTDARRAWRVTLLLFVSLAVHNFPEGLAVAASSLHSPHLGITTAVAIGLHNIPEGIAIAIPCLAARPDEPFLAFGLASLSGLTEPLGALVALTVLQVDMESMGNWLAFVASIMMAVAVAELFPEAWRNAVADNAKSAFWIGTALGFVIMVGSDAVLDNSLEV